MPSLVRNEVLVPPDPITSAASGRPTTNSETAVGSVVATTMSMSPTVSEKRRIEPHGTAVSTPATVAIRAASDRASGSASTNGVRRSFPCRPKRSIALPIFSSEVLPRPGRSRNCSAVMALRRPSMSSTPSSDRITFSVLGPRPGILVSSTNAGGYFSRRATSFATEPVDMNSRILSAVEPPTPLISVSSFLLRPVSSP